MTSIVVRNFRRICHESGFRVSCSLNADGLPSELWFETTGYGGTAGTDEPDWAAVALLYPSMLLGHDLVIDAAISPQLHYAMNNDLQALLRDYDHRLQRIRVIAGWATPAASGDGVATGFSGGIDSFATLAAYSDRDTPSSMRLTHLAVNDVGAFGRSGAARDNFRMAQRRAAALAKAGGMRLLTCSSNIDELYHAAGSRVFSTTHSLRNAAAAHVSSGVLSCYLYSSAVPFREIGLASMPKPDTAYIDPMLLPLLSTERFKIVSACAGLTRVEKTALVAGDRRAHRQLDVCVNGEHDREKSEFPNCSTCWKCVRTLATLEGLGKLDAFEGVFDLRKYHAERESLLRKLAARARSGVSLDQEVVDLLLSAGFTLPQSAPRPLTWIRRKLRSYSQAATAGRGSP